MPGSKLMNPNPRGPESLLATLLVHALKQGSPQVDELEFMRRYCFINAPTNKQRRAMLQTLQNKVVEHAEASWNVATVDKMQGQEANCVLSLYAYPDAKIEIQPGFIYSRHRINVALSRARCKGILLLTQQMLKLRPSILAEDPAIESGYAMFRHIHHLCRTNETVAVDVEGNMGGGAVQEQRAVRVVLNAEEMAVIVELYDAYQKQG